MDEALLSDFETPLRETTAELPAFFLRAEAFFAVVFVADVLLTFFGMVMEF